MKRNEVMALIATTILMFAVCSLLRLKGKRQSQSSMHRNEHKLSGILKRHQLGYIDTFYVKLCILFSRFNKIVVFLQNQLNNKRL